MYRKLGKTHPNQINTDEIALSPTKLLTSERLKWLGAGIKTLQASILHAKSCSHSACFHLEPFFRQVVQ